MGQNRIIIAALQVWRIFQYDFFHGWKGFAPLFQLIVANHNTQFDQLIRFLDFLQVIFVDSERILKILLNELNVRQIN